MTMRPIPEPPPVTRATRPFMLKRALRLKSLWLVEPVVRADMLRMTDGEDNLDDAAVLGKGIALWQDNRGGVGRRGLERDLVTVETRALDLKSCGEF